MKLSEQWLREWVDPPLTTDELAEQLTMAGFEVEAIESCAGKFNGVVVGRVEQVEALLTSSAKAGEVAMLSSVSNVFNLVLAQRASIIDSFPESVFNPLRFDLAKSDFSQGVLSGKDHLFGQSASQAVVNLVREEASIEGPVNKLMTIVKRVRDAHFRGRGSSGVSRSSGREGPLYVSRDRVFSSVREQSKCEGRANYYADLPSLEDD